MGYVLVTANRNYSSWSLRPWILMRALKVPFDDRVAPFAADDNWERFRAFSPTGQVPVLIDGERTVWDSLGIVLYLAERHPGVWPTDAAARAWAYSAACEMHGGFESLRAERPMNVGVRATPVPGSDRLRRDVARMGELWREGLTRFGGPWLAGEAFSAADAFYAPVAFRVRTYSLDMGAGAQDWADRLLSHPAAREWELQALAETWRETSHEAELAAAGAVTADYRAGG